MKMKKRFLSVLLSLVMVLGLMPGMSLTAYADLEISITPTGGGSVTQQIDGDFLKFIATPNTGFVFQKWTYTISGSSQESSVNSINFLPSQLANLTNITAHFVRTLINYPSSPNGITVNGNTSFSNVKIHENADSVNAISLASSYSATDNNYAVLRIEGGFKAGDVVTIAGAINQTDQSKTGTADLFTISDGQVNVLFTTAQLINGRFESGDPVAETYTLKSDVPELYLGRKGNAKANITQL